LHNRLELAAKVDEFLATLELDSIAIDPALMPGVFGYTAYDAVNAFDTVGNKKWRTGRICTIPVT
jgi:hypothetical protein